MELFRLAVGLILISLLSFAKAQVSDCPAFNVSDLGATDMLTQGGLVGSAFQAVSGDPSMPVNVQVHDSNIVCLRSGRTRDTYSGVSVVVNYTCTGAPSQCTGNSTLSQFEFECVAGTWTARVGGSATNIITTPPSGSLSTTLRTDCGVCISPARPGFATITNNQQHCGCEYNNYHIFCDFTLLPPPVLTCTLLSPPSNPCTCITPTHFSKPATQPVMLG